MGIGTNRIHLLYDSAYSLVNFHFIVLTGIILELDVRLVELLNFLKLLSNPGVIFYFILHLLQQHTTVHKTKKLKEANKIRRSIGLKPVQDICLTALSLNRFLN